MKKALAISAVALSVLLSSTGLPMAGTTHTAHAATSAQVQSAKGTQLVNTAKSFIGKVKYVWGVRDPQRLIFDCSSFTQYVYKLNGYTIPWGANSQKKVGSVVSSKSKLQVGDLVMLSTSTKGKITHVAIYAGNGQIVHDVPKKGVVVSSFTSGYWSTRFVTGRHVAN